MDYENVGGFRCHSGASLVGSGSGFLHPSLRMTELGEFELRVKTVGISSRQHPSTQALKFRMVHDHLHEPLTQALPAIVAQNEDVSDVSKRRFVTDDSCKTDLLFAMVKAETNRIRDRSLSLFTRTAICPV